MEAEAAAPIEVAPAAPAAPDTPAVPAADDLATAIAELQNVLLRSEDIDKFMHELAIQAARLVAGSLSCGITSSRAGQNATVACSDDLGSHVNQLQYELHEGPCLTALADACPVRADDLAADTRWPRFAAQASAKGISSVLSLPLIACDETVGALNLYALTRAAFGDEQARRAEQFAELAAGALALGLRLVSYAALTDQLRASLTSRAVIDQAVGVIMGRERCTQDSAFAVLRTASQNRNVKLRDVAQEVIADVSGQRPEPPPFEDS
jgi:transcriptional regulator with GAF, ATPase, and Fis domain